MPFNSVSSVCDFKLPSFAMATEISAGARPPFRTKLLVPETERYAFMRTTSPIESLQQILFLLWAYSAYRVRCPSLLPLLPGSAEDESDIDGLAEESAVLRITNHHVDIDLSADDTASDDSVRAVAWSDDSGLHILEADETSEIKSNGRGVERAVNGSALGRGSGGQKEVVKEEGMGGEEELGVVSEPPIPRLSSAEEPKPPYEFKILKPMSHIMHHTRPHLVPRPVPHRMLIRVSSHASSHTVPQLISCLASCSSSSFFPPTPSPSSFPLPPISPSFPPPFSIRFTSCSSPPLPSFRPPRLVLPFLSQHPPQPLPNGQTLPASMTRPASDEQPVGGDCLLAEEFGVTVERPANSSGHSGGWIGYGLELGQVQGAQGEQRAELWPQQVVEYDVVAAKTKSCHFVCVLPFHSKTQTVTLLKEYAQSGRQGQVEVQVGPGCGEQRAELWPQQVVEYDVVAAKTKSCHFVCALLFRTAQHGCSPFRGVSSLLFASALAPCLSTPACMLQAKLCGGQLIKLVDDDHPGLLEVKWCKNRFTPFLVIDPQDDSDPLPRDLEEFIEVHRVPVGDLQGMALSGDMLLPSVVTCTMALQYLKDNGWL
ncbi:unnamed protein product [Closterium sp. Yama58-4]|nr:unnamed protein product [Closterium sp. Yama58-4]